MKIKCKVILFSELREYHAYTKLFSGSGRGRGGVECIQFSHFADSESFFFLNLGYCFKGSNIMLYKLVIPT